LILLNKLWLQSVIGYLKADESQGHHFDCPLKGLGIKDGETDEDDESHYECSTHCRQLQWLLRESENLMRELNASN